MTKNVVIQRIMDKIVEKKIEKSSKIGLDKKSVIPTFAFY